MNLLHNTTNPLTVNPTGPSWTDPALLRAAARAADQHAVRGTVTFYDDGNTWSFKAMMSSNRCERPFPVMLAYLGDEPRLFAEVFSTVGDVFAPMNGS
ncbi:hypothetical protein [Microbacterium sp. GXS0129]|uniref:hypothetical protein n=1 Tax=Microbacterium sp. GXS0129 TaxID=3377836 RepID=UPI00383B1485